MAKAEDLEVYKKKHRPEGRKGEESMRIMQGQSRHPPGRKREDTAQGLRMKNDSMTGKEEGCCLESSRTVL